jgi:hypothetical protein
LLTIYVVFLYKDNEKTLVVVQKKEVDILKVNLEENKKASDFSEALVGITDGATFRFEAMTHYLKYLSKQNKKASDFSEALVGITGFEPVTPCL